MIVSVVMALTGCVDARPSLAEWRGTWETARATLPTLGDGSISNRACTDALGGLRTLAPRLESTPDQLLDGLIDSWLDIAEQAMFECPPRSGGTVGFEDAYSQLEVLEIEISIVLEQLDG